VLPLFSGNSDILHQAVSIVKHFFKFFLSRQARKLFCARLSFSGECYDITSLSQMQALFNKILRILFSLERKS
jgi:hypothetical protein